MEAADRSMEAIAGRTDFGNKDKWDTTGNGSEKRSRLQS